MIKYLVTGQGRTGTKWLAGLLTNENLPCYHEKFGRLDSEWYADCYMGEKSVGNWLEKRDALISDLSDDFSEVNSYLRYVVPQIRQKWHIPVAGLVRNPKRVIKSMEYLSIFANDRRTPFEVPPDEKFAKICWYFTDAYKKLIADNVKIFKLEYLNNDYNEVLELANFLGTEIDKDKWEQRKNNPTNVVASKDGAQKLSLSENEIFNKYCGEIAKQLGYYE